MTNFFGALAALTLVAACIVFSVNSDPVQTLCVIGAAGVLALLAIASAIIELMLDRR